MNKKAVAIAYSWLIQLLIIAMVMLAIFVSIQKVNNEIYFEKLFVKDDLSLYLETALASPESLNATYVFNPEFNINLEGDVILVKQKEEPDRFALRSYISRSKRSIKIKQSEHSIKLFVGK